MSSVEQIVSIDIGTYGFVAAFCPPGSPHHCRIIQDWPDSRACTELTKNLAALLIEKETNETVAMGYEAEELYLKSNEKKEENKYMYFEYFLKNLYSDNLKKNTLVLAADGEFKLPLADLIIKSFQYVMRHSLHYINSLNRLGGVDETSKDKTFWVISFSTICDKRAGNLNKYVNNFEFIDYTNLLFLLYGFVRDKYNADIDRNISLEIISIIRRYVEPAKIMYAGKELLKSCAKTAGMIHFELVSSSTAAIFYIINNQSREFKLRDGDKLMILDCGGTTIDAEFLDIKSSQRTGHFDITKLHHASAIKAGGLDVNERFNKLLQDLFPHHIVENIKNVNCAQWVRQNTEFEMAKLSCPVEFENNYWNVPFCFGMARMLARYKKKWRKRKDPAYGNLRTHVNNFEFVDYTDLLINCSKVAIEILLYGFLRDEYNVDRNIPFDIISIIRRYVEPAKIMDTVKLGRTNLRISNECWIFLHKGVLDKIVRFVNGLLNNMSMISCQKIVICGGMANSNFLCRRLENESFTIYKPRQPHLAVVKGALYWVCENIPFIEKTSIEH